jgi:hypothetical protein
MHSGPQAGEFLGQRRETLVETFNHGGENAVPLHTPMFSGCPARSAT